MTLNMIIHNDTVLLQNYDKKKDIKDRLTMFFFKEKYDCFK